MSPFPHICKHTHIHTHNDCAQGHMWLWGGARSQLVVMRSPTFSCWMGMWVLTRLHGEASGCVVLTPPCQMPEVERETLETWECLVGGGGRCMPSGLEGCTDVGKRKGHLSWWGNLHLRRLQRAKREKRGMRGEGHHRPNWHAGGPSSGAAAFLVTGMCVLNHFSCVRLCATLWTTAHQASLSMGFSRQAYWSGLPFPPPGDLPDAGIESTSLMSPAWAGRFLLLLLLLFLPLAPPGKPILLYASWFYLYIFILHYGNLSLWSWPLRLKLTASMKTYNTF